MYEKNFTMKKEGKKYEFSLGNFTDEGWYWDGGEDQAVGFIIRIARSKEKDLFLKDAEKEGISWDEFKPTLLKATQKKDGLYELSGDNVTWHFGNYNDELYELQEAEKERLEGEGWSEEDAEAEAEAKLDNTHIPYEKFEKEYGEYYVEEMTKLIEKSKSFKDFIEKLGNDSLITEWLENTTQYIDSAYERAPGDKELERKYRNKKREPVKA